MPIDRIGPDFRVFGIVSIRPGSIGAVVHDKELRSIARDQLKGIDPAFQVLPRDKKLRQFISPEFWAPSASADAPPRHVAANFRRNVKPLYEITPSAIYIQLSYGGGGTCGARKAVKSILRSLALPTYYTRVTRKSKRGYIKIIAIVQAGEIRAYLFGKLFLVRPECS